MAKVIVVGGGAAGMMAAIAAAESGQEVVLYEKNEKLGKKLYITGKGRCNVTNAGDKEDFFEHVVSNERFLYSSFEKWNNWDMYDFLSEQGMALKIERGNRVFPESDKSSDVIRTLQRGLEKRGVTYHLRTEVKGLVLEKKPEKLEEGPRNVKRGKKETARWVCRGVILAGGKRVLAERVIVATGGLSYPATGSTGDGYRWAEEAGHTVVEPVPALVPFDAALGDGSSCQDLQGLALKNVGVRVFEGGRQLAGDFGEMLFTHFGVSGPLVLTASSLVARRIPRGELRMLIDLKPALSEEKLDARFLRELTAGANRQMKNLLGALYPAKLVPVMLRLAAIPPEKKGREVSREERKRLLTLTKAFPVRLLGARSFREAIITQGGISVKEIQPSTMASKKVDGLYFAGEILDVDACTGGYNLQIAWSTGYAAGKN